MTRFYPHGISPPRLQPGFTLVEMTIVLLIVSLLLAGVLMPLSMQMELRRYADTKKTMDQINEALIGFALAKGRLPCPANPALADGVATAGEERGACTAAGTNFGVIPWVTLNVPETDEWGGRFTYRVTSEFADPPPSTFTCSPPAISDYSSFRLCDSGDMKVKSRTKADVYDMTNGELPAVYISHGKNGYGAYGPRGTLLHAVPPSTDESANATASTVIAGKTIFFSREKTDDSSPCSDSAGTTTMCEFDDLVTWIPLTTLMNRMVVSGKLP